MGRVKITEKPGVWPYVLVNDFKSPPYFAYEHVDENGKRSFIRVLKGGPEEEQEQQPILNLTLKRKAKITRFLKDVVETPLRYGEFMSQEWIEELVKFLDLYDERYIEARSQVVEHWLKDEVFKQLVREIGESTAAAKVSEECTASALSSQKQQVSEKDSSDDDSLFTPIVVRVRRTQATSKMD